MLHATTAALRPVFPIQPLPVHPDWGKKLLAIALAMLCHAALLWLLVYKPATIPPAAIPMATFEMVTLREPPQPVVQPPPPPSPPEPEPAPAVIETPPPRQAIAPPLPPAVKAPPRPVKKTPRVNKPQAVAATPVATEATTPVVAPPPAAAVVSAAPVETPPSSKAAYLNNPKPHYPPFARRQGMEGVVLLAVEVDAEGHPLSVTLKKGSGYEMLDRAALQAVQQWRFVPAQRAGVAVRAQVDVPVRFQLTEK